MYINPLQFAFGHHDFAMSNINTAAHNVPQRRNYGGGALWRLRALATITPVSAQRLRWSRFALGEGLGGGSW
jgi:hypothetical protein